MHDKKQKGDIGVAKVIADLTENGWNPAVPITEHAKYDLLAESDGTVIRIQVRYSKADANKTCLEVKLRNSWADKNGTHIRHRERGDFDVLAVYCPDTDEVYYLRDNAFANKCAITLRLKDCKNGQKVSWLASEFKKLSSGVNFERLYQIDGFEFLWQTRDLVHECLMQKYANGKEPTSYGWSLIGSKDLCSILEVNVNGHKTKVFERCLIDSNSYKLAEGLVTGTAALQRAGK